MTALDGFEATTFTHDGVTRDLYRSGTGPAVIVLAEIPGITRNVIAFAERVRDLGCSVWLPRMFGKVPASVRPAEAVQALVPACVASEFAAFATGRTEPVSVWLRALARHAHEASGGPGVGVVGMCFTGGFALGMMVDEVVVAPVLSQPSLPVAATKRAKRDIHLSPDDLAAVKARVGAGACVLGLRFTGDPMVPGARFETLRRELGDGFIGVEIDSSKGNAWGIPRAAHSVLTEHLVSDDPEHPTAQALQQVLDFLRERLEV